MLEAFGITELGAVVRPAGADSEHWCATRGDAAPVVLRFERYPGRPLPAVLGWCAQLAEAGVPCATPSGGAGSPGVLTDASGEWTCWQAVEGEAVTPSVAAAAQAGALLAQLHAVVPATPGPRPALLGWLDALEAWDPAAAARIAAVDGEVRICHGDLHAGNCRQRAGVLWALDFVDAGLAAPALDVAIAAVYWGTEAGPDAVDAVRAGYAQAQAVLGSDPRHSVCDDTLVSAVARLVWTRDRALYPEEALPVAAFCAAWSRASS